VVYEVDSSGQESVLYSFPGGPGGALGGSSLYRDREGDLYGTTIAGGGASYEAGGGVVFELDTEGNYTVLYRFTGGAGGGGPFAGVIRDSAGNLYGTASTGGTTDCTVGGCGVVYKLSPSGEETVLHTFTGGADGDTPYSGLVADAVGNLYGTTTWGGKGGFSGAMFSGGGVVYKIEPH
jgi:uncharacterized repeat protein (TIGR03803 family)